jgi:hypothetical protein
VHVKIALRIRLVPLIATLVAITRSSAIAQDPTRSIRALGEFSNMRLTEEHAYGYSVQLWRDGDSLIGLFLASEGLQGDTPTGALENVKYDPRTGSLSFAAKLSMGVNVLPGGKQEPSRDLFEFTGTLNFGVIHVAAVTFVDGTLTGELKHSDPRAPSRKGSPQHIELKYRKEADVLPATSYAEWKRQADEILKRRGPKW